MLCLLRHPRIQSIVSTIMTEWARCCLHSGPSSTTTRQINGFYNPKHKQVLYIIRIFNICPKKYFWPTRQLNYNKKFKETLHCSRTLRSGRPQWKFLSNTEKICPPYSQLWLPVQGRPDEWLARRISPPQVRDPRTGGWWWRQTSRRLQAPCEASQPAWAAHLQEYDTIRLNQSTKNLPHWKMQRHDVQNRSNESMGVVGWGSRDFSCHSQVLF